VFGWAVKAVSYFYISGKSFRHRFDRRGSPSKTWGSACRVQVAVDRQARRRAAFWTDLHPWTRIGRDRKPNSPMPARSPTSSTSSNAFSRFSRNLGFGLNSKSQSSSPFGRNNRESVRPVVQEEQWYIPYNGPYEPPPTPKPLKRKDSWGDPIYGEAGDLYDVDVLLGDPELHKRYGGNHVPNKPSLDSRWSEDGEEEERKGRTRDRVMSTVSGRTVSSGTVDPNRTSFVQQRRSTISHTPQSIGVNGSGIGDSPMPVTHSHSQRSKTLKKGQTSRKEIPPTPQWRPDDSPLMFSRTANYQAIPKHPADKIASAPSSPKSPTRSSISDEWNNQPSSKRNFQPVASGLRDSLATTDEEYYASYYSSLTPAQTTNGYSNAPPLAPKGPRIFNQNQSEHQAKPSMSSSTSTHPYAYVFPSAAVHPELPTPQRAPLSSTLQNNLDTYQYPRPPQLIVTHPSRDVSSAGPSSHGIKNSVSTPNLRAAANQPFVLPKGKERWLSAETWCDAILFPRPRFKMKDLEAVNGKKKTNLVRNTPRIVSPPDSPVYPHDPSAPPDRKEAMPSRVLAHSRSLVDLNRQNSRGELSNSSSLRPLIPPPIEVQPLDPKGKSTRPRSFAWDDMALPSPIPSLSKFVFVTFFRTLKLICVLLGCWKKEIFLCISGESGSTKHKILSGTSGQEVCQGLGRSRLLNGLISV
jgi:serine/arginine repetitive matrix protein 2